MAGNFHLAANRACFVDDAHCRLFHRDVQSCIMFHAALPFLMLVAVSDRPRSTISSKRSTSMPLRQDGAQAEYPILDGAFLAHCRLRRWQGFGISGMIQDT
ncbi:hypothetical protein X759_30565 [Mesorhizobium sp. LSHC420B00]|nr:hypothetical protein X759_30565 [Mesorhizobium sp. LSHC420B00]